MSALCSIHPSLPADHNCFRCERHICDACTTHTPGGLACPACVASLSDGKLRNKAIIFGAIAVLVVGVAGYLVGTRDTQGPRLAPHALLSSDFNHRDATAALNRMAEALETEPCNRSIAIKLAGELNRHGDYAATLRVVATHDAPAAGCRPFRKLWWKQLYAHEQLDQWDKAVLVGDKLVTAKPRDADYWRWRAKANRKIERPAAALVDLRQSLARRPGRSAAYMLYEMDPCEGGFALLTFFNRKPTETDAETTALASLAQPECASLRGTGSLELSWEAGQEAPALDITVAGTMLRGKLAPGLGTTIVSQANATKLGLVPQGGAVTALVGTKVISVQPTLIDELVIGDARVTKVPAVIAPSLEGDVDLVLGQSLLWRFEVLITQQAINFYELPLGR